MGTTKSEEFSVKDNRVSRYAKALSHPARIAILKLLIKKQSCICGDIVDELEAWEAHSEKRDAA